MKNITNNRASSPVDCCTTKGSASLNCFSVTCPAATKPKFGLGVGVAA